MVSKTTDNPEALREALFHLEHLREQEKTARQQMEALVGGLHVLNECQSVNDMYREILDCLNRLIDFDAAAILVEDHAGFLSTAVASDPRLRFKNIAIEGIFKRCLNGRATVVTDLLRVPDWPTQPNPVDSDINYSDSEGPALVSALLVALPALNTRMILMCASETASRLQRKELKLLQSFTPLATQAVRRAIEMEKLNYLVTTLDHQAHFDLLTGLPNRTLLEHKLNSVGRSADDYTLLFLDLDNFKSVNDTFGHAVGDILLSEIAFRMSSRMGRGDTIARLGGDEFALIIQSRTTRESIETLCQELLIAIRQPLFLRSGRIVPGASIGVFFSESDHHATQLAMQNADIAMYGAKSMGRNCYCIFNDAMKSSVEARFEVESQLPLAIRQKQFHLVYQPIVKVESRACNRIEVLVRWGNIGQSKFSPAVFIPIAEKTGDIIELGKWIVRQSLVECRDWLGLSPVNTLSINVSQVQLKRIGFAAEFVQLVASANVRLAQIKLELSENIIADSIDSAVSDNIDILDQHGIRFAFDDFGTGSSSLLHLQKFPGTCLKIDKSFVDEIVSNDSQRRLVAGMIDLAHHMEMDVVAEGVEDDLQLDVLVKLGVDFIQGYVFAKPAIARQTFALIAEWDRSNALGGFKATGS